MPSALTEIVAGSLAGSAGKIIEYPFDTAKVRLQTQNVLAPRYSGALDCLTQMLKHDGIRGLYRGVSAPMVAAAAENATLFTSFAFFNNLLGPEDFQGKALLCGSGSGLVASFVLTPIELVKCEIQVTALSHTHAEPRSIFKHIITIAQSPDGIRAFWRGQTGTSFREAGGSAAWFGTYHALSDYPTVLAGACAGVAYNASLFPADTIKSRMQTEAMLGRPRLNFYQTALGILRESGVPGLYRGVVVTCLRAAPGSAVIFSVFEYLKAKLVLLE